MTLRRLLTAVNPGVEETAQLSFERMRFHQLFLFSLFVMKERSDDMEAFYFSYVTEADVRFIVLI